MWWASSAEVWVFSGIRAHETSTWHFLHKVISPIKLEDAIIIGSEQVVLSIADLRLRILKFPVFLTRKLSSMIA